MVFIFESQNIYQLLSISKTVPVMGTKECWNSCSVVWINFSTIHHESFLESLFSAGKFSAFMADLLLEKEIMQKCHVSISVCSLPSIISLSIPCLYWRRKEVTFLFMEVQWIMRILMSGLAWWLWNEFWDRWMFFPTYHNLLNAWKTELNWPFTCDLIRKWSGFSHFHFLNQHTNFWDIAASLQWDKDIHCLFLFLE